MKVIRVLKYEGPEEWIKDTLSKSLPDGTRYIGSDRQIAVVTLGVMPDCFDLLTEEEINERQRGLPPEAIDTADGRAETKAE
jgi:hypothetical protein